MDRISKKNFILAFSYYVLILLIVVFTSVFSVKYLWPFLLGIIIAFAVQKPSIFLSKILKVPHNLLAVLISVIVFLLAGAVLIFLSYRLILSITGLIDFLPKYLVKIQEIIQNIQVKYSSVFGIMPDKISSIINVFFESTMQNFAAEIGGYLTGFLSNIAKKTPSFFISGIVTLVSTCYIAKDFSNLSKFVKSILGKTVSGKINKIKNILVGSVFKIVKGNAILCLITFFELYVGFLILKIEYPLALSMVITLVDILPIIGTGTIIIPWAVILALIGNYSLSIGLGILYIFITVIRNFIEPKIISMQIGINSLFILIAMFLGYKILGVLGIIIFPIILIVTIRYYKDEMKEELSV